MLVPNTAFNSQEAFIYIQSDATYSEVRSDLQPLLLDVDKFDLLAQQKKYTKNVKPGRYRISKGMTNNDIINYLRSQNLTVIVAFNNQHNLEALAHRVSNQIEADSLSLISAFRDSLFLRSNGFSPTALAMYLPQLSFWNTGKQLPFQNQKAYNRFWNSERKAKAKELGLSPKQVSILCNCSRGIKTSSGTTKNCRGIHQSFK